MPTQIDETARVVESTIGEAEIREHVTIHDSTVGDDCRIYERTSLKKATVADAVDINAGTYVENAHIETEVQIAPNSSLVGVTHGLQQDGMEFRNDVFEEINVGAGAFIGAGAVVAPGTDIGKEAVISAGATVTDDVAAGRIVLGSPPSQQVHDVAEWLDR